MVDPPSAAPPPASAPLPDPVGPTAGWPPLAPAVIPPPPGPVGRVAVGLAGLALVAFAVAVVVLAIPVEVPDVQDCGAPGAYLLAGRVDRIPDEENRIRDADDQIVTLDDDVADEARSTPCRDRVAARAVPAAGLIVGSTVLGFVAFALELFVVRPRQRRLMRAAAAGPPEPLPPA